MKKTLLLMLVLSVALGAVWAGGGGEDEAESEGPERLKLAACFSTPIEEPWPAKIHLACQTVAEENNLDYDMTEDIGYTDFDRVVREYCERGYDIITGDAFGNEEVVRRVAEEYPEVAFAFGSGLGPVEPNFSVFDNWIHETAYLCGLIAGSVTETDVIGVVAQMDIPEVNRIANGFIVGVKEVNPDARVLGSYIGSFWDPPKTKEAALGIIEAGADVMYSMIYGGIEAAAENDIYAFGNMSDQWELAPDHVITSPIWDVYPTIKAVVEAVQGGYFTAENYGQYSFMAKGGTYLAPYHNFEGKMPELEEFIEAKTQTILDGRYVVPIDEQTAKFDTLR